MDKTINGENVNDIYLGLCNICDYGQNIDLLNAYERTIFITQELENEVNNGGFSQFFDNSSGQFAYEIVQAFSIIGAVKTAEICAKAVGAFKHKLPTDWEERRALLDKIEDEGVASILEACDNAFYECEEDLESLNAEYIRNNIEHFNFSILDI